ncbi:MAG TPA: hypothetical protein VHV30_01575 [Polyangiaceae bacterium]|jgi:hypothetical protein|nr:hypothetical protein [Polyangiaceae bacterium]
MTPPAAGPAAAAPGLTPIPAPTPQEIQHRRLPVDIESTKPGAVVERRVTTEESDGVYFFVPFRSSTSTWEQVCVAPCQVDLDRFSTYRVSGRNGISPSKGSFTLPQSGDSLNLQLDAGNLLMHRAGLAMSGAGLAAVIVGTALIAGQSIFTDEDKARNAGFITGGAGLVVMAIGIPLAVLTVTGVSANNQRFAWTPKGFAF